LLAQPIAAWVGLEPHLGERGWNQAHRRLAIDWGNLRELTVRAAEFVRLRGTRGLLVTMLEVATAV